MKWLDEKTDVIEWSSEELSIAYKSPVDNRAHRYFPDMLAKIRQPDGSIKTILIEIKPEKQTKEPKKQKKYLKSILQRLQHGVSTKLNGKLQKIFVMIGDGIL
jgi:hypothetical protein